MASGLDALSMFPWFMDQSGFEQHDPYSQYQGVALPQTSYFGVPTDAMGKPDSVYLQGRTADQAQRAMTRGFIGGAPGASASPAAAAGTTLNTSQPSSGLSNYMPGNVADLNTYMNTLTPDQRQQYWTANNPLIMPNANNNPSGSFGGNSGGGSSVTYMPTASTPAAATPQAGNSLYGQQNYQDALNSMSHPNKVTTPGSAVPAGPAYQPNTGVLNAMMQNWNKMPGTSLNTSFINSLRGLQ